MPLPTMHLRAPQGRNELCVVIRASLLSQVATGLLYLRDPSDGSEVKTTEAEKSYKE
jgi:hypothetical protein